LFGRLGQSYFLCDCHPHVANSKNILELKSFADESAEKKKKRKRRKHRQVTRKETSDDQESEEIKEV